MKQIVIHSRNRGRAQRGFTLIELLTVLVIMSVITLVFFNRQTKFDSSTLMRSLTYSIALSVRQAQVYGISVRPTPTSVGTFATAHGLFFSNSYAHQYIMFADSNNDHMYTSDPIDQTFNLNQNFSISEFCAVGLNSVSAPVKRCSGPDDTSGTASISALDILFIRPNPDAMVYAYQGVFPSYTPIAGDTYNVAYVQIMATDGTKRGIHIYSTGQVAVDPICTLSPFSLCI